MNKKVDAFKYWFETNMEKGCSTIPEYLCKDVLDYVDTLENALDKACEELSRLNNYLDRRVITTSAYWEEWLLKEVQEDE